MPSHMRKGIFAPCSHMITWVLSSWLPRTKLPLLRGVSPRAEWCFRGLGEPSLRMSLRSLPRFLRAMIPLHATGRFLEDEFPMIGVFFAQDRVDGSLCVLT